MKKITNSRLVRTAIATFFVAGMLPMSVSAATSGMTVTQVVEPGSSVSPSSGGGGGGTAPVTLPLQIYDIVINTTQNGVSISWKTNRQTQSVFSWGDTKDYGRGSTSEVDLKYEHNVLISNLLSGHLFFFTIDATTAFNGLTSVSGAFTTQSLPAPESPPNVSVLIAESVKASSGQNQVSLKWQNPTSPLFLYARVMRSEAFFPDSPVDGTVVYEGSQEFFIDTDVVVGTRYYYSVFSGDTDHRYSSGAVTQVVAGESSPILLPSGDIFEQLPLASNVDPIIKKLTIGDFFFFQRDRQIEIASSTVHLEAGEPFSITLAYEKVPEILKTIAVTLTDSGGNDYTFLLRVDKDKKTYRADLSALPSAGNYEMNVVILDYQNQALKKIKANVAAVGTASSDVETNVINEYGAVMFTISVLLLVVSFVLKIILVLKRILVSLYRKYRGRFMV